MKKACVIIAALFALVLSGCASANTVPQDSSANSAEVASAGLETEASSAPEQTEPGTEAPSGAESAVPDETPAGQQDLSDPSGEVSSAPEQVQEAFQNLNIEISGGTLYIRSGSQFSLTRHSGADADYQISGGTLYLKISHSGDLVLTLPGGESYETLTLSVQNGHAYVEGALTVNRLELDMDQGEVSTENLTVLTGSSVTVKNGSASLYGDPGPAVTAVCRQGHLNFAVPFAEEECSYHIELSGGNVSLGRHSYHGASESRTVDNGASRSMELTCVHGDLSVQFGR